MESKQNTCCNIITMTYLMKMESNGTNENQISKTPYLTLISNETYLESTLSHIMFFLFCLTFIHMVATIPRICSNTIT